MLLHYSFPFLLPISTYPAHIFFRYVGSGIPYKLQWRFLHCSSMKHPLLIYFYILYSSNSHWNSGNRTYNAKVLNHKARPCYLPAYIHLNPNTMEGKPHHFYNKELIYFLSIILSVIFTTIL